MCNGVVAVGLLVYYEPLPVAMDHQSMHSIGERALSSSVGEFLQTQRFPRQLSELNKTTCDIRKEMVVLNMQMYSQSCLETEAESETTNVTLVEYWIIEKVRHHHDTLADKRDEQTAKEQY
eukprot:4096659-Ditylum_brightwellii.AAC.2